MIAFTAVRIVLLSTACSLGFALSSAEGAQFASFDAPDGGNESGQGTIPEGMNKLSTVAGVYLDSGNNYHGFLRAADGSITEFDAFGAQSQTLPVAINDKGATTGWYKDPNTGIFEGFVRAPGGQITSFDASEGNSQKTYGLDINNKGEISGDYADLNGTYHGYLRAPDGTITTFDAPDAGKSSGVGTGYSLINSKGVVAGTYIDSGNVRHGFLRALDGTITEFDAPGAGTGSGQGTLVAGLNRKGRTMRIAGIVIDAGNVSHGYVRDANGAITTFDAPDAGSGPGQGTEAFGINRHGTLTGDYIDANGVYHAFLRSKNGTIAEFDPPGTGLASAGVDIDDDNDITGYYIDSGNVYHGFLRKP